MTENSSTAAGGPAVESFVRGDWEPGRTAYDAYGAAVGGVSVRGEQLPSWEALQAGSPAIAAAWEHAADAVLDQAGRGQSDTDPAAPAGTGAG